MSRRQGVAIRLFIRDAPSASDLDSAEADFRYQASRIDDSELLHDMDGAQPTNQVSGGILVGLISPILNFPLIRTLGIVMLRPRLRTNWATLVRHLPWYRTMACVIWLAFLLVLPATEVASALIRRDPLKLIFGTIHLIIFAAVWWVGIQLSNSFWQRRWSTVHPKDALGPLLAETGMMKRINHDTAMLVVALILLITLEESLADFGRLDRTMGTLSAAILLGGALTRLPNYLARTPTVLILTTSSPANVAWIAELTVALWNHRVVTLLEPRHLEADEALREVELSRVGSALRAMPYGHCVVAPLVRPPVQRG